MRSKNLVFVMLALFVFALLVYPVREYMKTPTDYTEDEEWNKQVEIDASEWAKSPAGKRRIAEQNREKELYAEATKTVLERHGLTNLSNDTTPPDAQLMNEIMEEMMTLKRKEK